VFTTESAFLQRNVLNFLHRQQRMSSKSLLSLDNYQLSVVKYLHLRYGLSSSDEVKITTFNSDTFLMFCHLSLMVNVPLYVIRIIYYFNDGLDRYYDIYLTILFSVLLFISIVCMYVIWYLRRDCNQGHRLSMYIPTLQVTYLFSAVAFNALRLFTQIYQGTAHDQQYTSPLCY